MTVTALNDDDTADDAVTLTHAATSTDGNYSGITIAGVSVTVTDNDTTTPAVTLALSAASIGENGGVSTVTATVSPASAAAFTVTVAAAAVAPAVAADFRLSANQILSFAENATDSTGSVTITGVDNDVDAADKTVTVSGTVSATGVTAPPNRTLTLEDDDAANTLPSFTSSAAFNVDENETAAGKVMAEDNDTDDAVTGYAITGGADSSFFSIGVTSGDLTFDAAPNFENAQDQGAGNTYAVTVQATSGTGTREKTATQGITVTVTNVGGEAPFAPSAPSVAAASLSSLSVTWTAPDNEGPAVTDYNYRHRTASPEGSWTEVTDTTSTALSATIGSLAENTSYDVQVRARNAEGTGDWSASGTGMTVAPLRVPMTSDLPPPVESAFAVRFSFSEPVRGFTGGDIETRQEPPCTDSANNPVSCNPTMAALQTTDDRIFTTTVTPRTDQVAHNYTLTFTVPAGRVTSAAGNKPNEEATLEMRVAPPGVTVPISSIGLTANPGNSQVTLRWNTPQNTGGPPIVRYEYRWAESGGEFSAWVSVAPAERSATVRELTNGREYMFEIRPVNALGYGLVTTARAAARSGGGGPPGGGGPRQTVPRAPINLVADATDGAVTLTWEAPENDGGSEITDYEYRIDRRNPWISIGSTDTAHTVTGLVNGTAYVFEVRAVNRIGKSFSSNRAEATPEAPEVEVFTLDFAHFANGTGITSEMVLVNVAPHPIRPAIYFYDRGGHLIDPESVVDVTGDLEVTEDGSLSVFTEMEPLGQLTISTHGQGELVSGSVKVLSDGPLGGGVRYGVPQIGVAGVGASEPVRDVLFPARRQEGGIRTAAALHNLGEEAVGVNCRLMSGGVSLEEVEIPLEADGQTSWFIDQAFPTTDTSDFVGSVRCTVLGSRRFTAIAVEMDAAQRIFNTLSVVPAGADGRQKQADYSEFCAYRQRDLDHRSGVRESVHRGEPSRPQPLFIRTSRRAVPLFISTTPRATRLPPSRWWTSRAIWRSPMTAALTVQSEMEPLGVLTISTHGRGQLVTGSARVVSQGPIGGMLRFEHPDFGVAGVGASPPLSDALFPVRRQEGGINDRSRAAQPGIESGPAALRLDAGGRAARRREHPSGGQRADVLAHRPGVPRRRYVRLRRIGALRCGGGEAVQRRGPGNGLRQPHLRPAARRAGPGDAGSGIDARWTWEPLEIREKGSEAISPGEVVVCSFRGVQLLGS